MRDGKIMYKFAKFTHLHIYTVYFNIIDEWITMVFGDSPPMLTAGEEYNINLHIYIEYRFT